MQCNVKVLPQSTGSPGPTAFNPVVFIRLSFVSQSFLLFSLSTLTWPFYILTPPPLSIVISLGIHDEAGSSKKLHPCASMCVCSSEVAYVCVC